MTNHKQEYKVISVLIILGVIIYIPTIFTFLVNIYLLKVIAIALNTLYLGIWIYTYTLLKKLLNEKLKTHTMDTILSILIITNVISALLTISSLSGIAISQIVNVTQFFMLFIAGGLSIFFGIKFLHLENSLYGKNKIIAYLNIIQGICYISIILVPVGIVLQLISDTVFAIVFNKASVDNG